MSEGHTRVRITNRTTTRTRTIVAVAGLVLALLAACNPVTSQPTLTGGGTTTTVDDPVTRRNVDRADEFVRWLRGAKGWIGEIGWPDDPRWNAAADKVYARYDAANVSITAWEASDWWCPDRAGFEGGSGDYAVYCASNSETFDRVLSSASVVEKWVQRPGVQRGINLLDSEFGTCWGSLGCSTGDSPRGWFSNVNRGNVNADPGAYKYPDRADMQFVRNRGNRTIRLPFRWERLQPALGQPFDAAELGRLRQAVLDAQAVGLEVIVTPFSWAAYWLHDASCNCGIRRPIGSAQVTSAHFADLWTRLAFEFGPMNHVTFGLSGEPAALPGGAAAWERISREAVSAIRRVDPSTFIWVPTYNYSAVFTVEEQHPAGPWITDPNVGWEGHHYLNDTGSGDYQTWEQETAAAQRAGY